MIMRGEDYNECPQQREELEGNASFGSFFNKQEVKLRLQNLLTQNPPPADVPVEIINADDIMQKGIKQSETWSECEIMDSFHGSLLEVMDPNSSNPVTREYEFDIQD